MSLRENWQNLELCSIGFYQNSRIWLLLYPPLSESAELITGVGEYFFDGAEVTPYEESAGHIEKLIDKGQKPEAGR